MNKDVIYIDVEDDITAIIGKVKASGERIVALVPPKRTGVLQSAVNLRLLARAAKQADKRLVVVTNNQALSGLAAAAEIPVAKNLQSKPEIAEIPALEVDDDAIIDGADISVSGDTANSSDDDVADVAVAALAGTIDLDKNSDGVSAKKPKSKAKIPNFSRFRKKLFLIIAGVIVLIGGLIWALVFAPAATVIITANTTAVPVNGILQLGSETNAQDSTLEAIIQSSENEVKIEFDATGEKNIGEKATGNVNFSNNSTSSRTVAAGTRLTASGGLVFTLNSAVTVPGGTVSCPTIFTCSGTPGTASGGVTASEAGTNYNAATGSLSGAGSGVTTSFSGATGGGTDKVVAIVTAADVQAAKEKLVQASNDDIKQQLEAKFSSDDTVIDNSFAAAHADPTSTPAIGEEVDGGKATLTSKTTYTMYAVSKTEIDAYMNEAMKANMEDQTKQKVFSTGASDATLTEFAKTDTGATVRFSARGQVGPVINEDDIKAQVAGKRYGDIQEELSKINGVSNVEVKFSYFWVRTVPSDESKITIEFKVQEVDG